ncbi:MAG: TylF/MycF family methyltransferase [Chitinophagaceae bacterium]|nr:TylF/MycF family methyltransferase [Chitinophagaceae bacterium]
MKSFVSFPFEVDILLSNNAPQKASGKLVAHYELFKKIKNLNGAVVKCGVTAEEGFNHFAMFKALTGRNQHQQMIAFQKSQPFFIEEVNESGDVTMMVKTHNLEANTHLLQKTLIDKGHTHYIDFVPGDVSESIPDYLIENPELKIAMLHIDLDDYEGTTDALEFLFPRIVQGGILILDNYHKNSGEKKAMTDYFRPMQPLIQNFSVNNGPHYIINQ